MFKQISSPDLKGWEWDEFEETFPMSTYLVALITTDFKFRSIKSGDLELKVKIHTRLTHSFSKDFGNEV